ncbi:MAG: hypothetical protein II784_00745 [Oscillospiraceae bacterium]|nr:hypothetical protein [Oscillospiraceae bacterium]
MRNVSTYLSIDGSPYFGRFFSGKLGAAQVKGAATQGVYCCAKHFALNDQESNRLSLSVWANEQSMRELYFKPFELTVKEGGTTAVMSSYSHLGTTWAGASKALITDVLRGEWGFTGIVVTDSAMGNTSWMDPNLAIRAGNDMMLCLMGASLDSSNNTARQAMREACHNILYTQANSRAVSVEADNTPFWYLLPALLNGIVLGIAILFILKLTAFKDKKLGWIGAAVVIAAIILALVLTWALSLRGTRFVRCPSCSFIKGAGNRTIARALAVSTEYPVAYFIRFSKRNISSGPSPSSTGSAGSGCIGPKNSTA